MSFTSLGLAEPLLRAVAEQGYDTPSPIQQQAIPAVLAGRDLMAAAQTGTGKTAGFTLPMLQRLTESKRKVSPNRIRALVLTPTRELAAQVGESVRNYGKHLPIRSHVVFGGVSINPQMMATRRGLDVLVACPGRLMDLYNQNAVKFDEVEILVLDEADRMLDMGFIRDIRRILALLPKKRQNLLFSATFADEIRELATGLLDNPAVIEVTPRNSTAERIEQLVHPCDKANKIALLSHLVTSNDWQQVLVFTRTKHMANRVAETLDNIARGIGAPLRKEPRDPSEQRRAPRPQGQGQRQGAGRSANGGNGGGNRSGNGGKPKPQGGQRPEGGAAKPAQARRPRRASHNQ